MSPDVTTLASLGRRVLLLESAAVAAAAERLDWRFDRAVEVLQKVSGRVIVSGVGKSGLIARKIAATLTSTGTAATYLHPVDSLHGDLGIVGPGDAAILVSKSGESEELFGLAGVLQRREVPIIAITGAMDSVLARLATAALDGSVTEEACPHDLAPTTSTTVALALGDALAIALLEVNGFRREDFAAVHPGGRLGRKLTLRVRDVMLAPARLLGSGATMREAVVTLAHERGLAMVVEDGSLLGVLTPGDLTRLAEQSPDFLARPVVEVMTRTPRTAAPDDLAASAAGTMERYGVIALPVVERGTTVVGVIHLHDLMRAGAV
ncbi:MAG TPA: KpsF/GutQ family sugar-phosphate isomerase [Gemmatimonadales bacterium]